MSSEEKQAAMAATVERNLQTYIGSLVIQISRLQAQLDAEVKENAGLREALAESEKLRA